MQSQTSSSEGIPEEGTAIIVSYDMTTESFKSKIMKTKKLNWKNINE
jgi:hypothetical protein